MALLPPNIRPAPRLRVEFRHPRPRPGALRAPDAQTYLFEAEQVRDLLVRALEMGRSLQWVMARSATLEVEGSPVWCVRALDRCDCLVDHLRVDLRIASTTTGSRYSPTGSSLTTGFRVTLPIIDLQRLLAHPDGTRLLVIRHAGDECWLACITTAGTVHSIRHNPLDVLRMADDLLLKVVSTGACANVRVRARIEDYLRERHLIS